MSQIKLLLVIFVLSVCVYLSKTTISITGLESQRNYTHTDKLRQDLLLSYDKFARPTQHYNITTVRFKMLPIHVDLDEFQSTLTVHCLFRFVWTDEKLKWNATDYGNLDILYVKGHEIWQPDIYVSNSISSYSIIEDYNTDLLVYSNGEVDWEPSTHFTVLCNLNMKYWPFDTQACLMKFSSRTYDEHEMDILPEGGVIDLHTSFMINNTEWRILEAFQIKAYIQSAYSKDSDPSYANAMTVAMVLARASPTYKAIIIIPAFVIIGMMLLNFWLPPPSGEKIMLNSCTAVMICLFMLYFTQKIPAMKNHTPLIVLFYSSCLYMVSLSLIGSIIVIALSKRNRSEALPWVIKRTLTGTVGKVLGLGTYMAQPASFSDHGTAEEMRDHQVTDFEESSNGDEHQYFRSDTNSNKTSFQEDWLLLAAAVDRISFILYCFLFLILALVFSL